MMTDLPLASSEALRANVDAQQKWDTAELVLPANYMRDDSRWQAYEAAREALHFRAEHSVSGLSAVSSQLLAERAKVQDALERLEQCDADLVDAHGRAERDQLRAGCLGDIEAILRRSGDPGTDQDGKTV